MELSAEIKARAHALGFQRVGIIPVGPSRTQEFYREWLNRGYAGEMAYLHRHAPLKADPTRWQPSARSMICLAANYNPPAPITGADSSRGRSPLRGRVSRYAWGRDYHEVLSDKVDELAKFIEQRAGCPVNRRHAVDSAPVMEREWAARAGLGWVGKNAMLIDRRLGSWLFLAELLVDLALKPLDAADDDGQPRAAPPAETDQSPLVLWESCGSCTACIDACPTGAIIAEKTVDARRCISYLTIELKGPIPQQWRAGIGDWVFGCDVCQDVCPWNRQAPATAESAFEGDRETAAPDLIELLALDESEFQARYRHSPIRRAKRKGLARNAAIALGNAVREGAATLEASGGGRPRWLAGAIRALIAAMHDREPVVRGAAAWALGPFGRDEARQALRAALDRETDDVAATEIRCALNGTD